jgi:hypothetical protein
MTRWFTINGHTQGKNNIFTKLKATGFGVDHAGFLLSSPRLAS